MTLIFPGSFDPVTMGHVSIARRAAKFADRLIVAVLENPNKNPLFSVAERTAFLKDALRDVKNLEIESFCGLLADYAQLKGADAILRGLRNSGDFEREAPYAAYNSRLSETEIETIFLPAAPQFAHVSSSIIKEAAAHMNEDRFGFTFLAEQLPPAARAAMQERMKSHGCTT
ncbi:MAG: pantetheine-phosphate adenylyltransferase [Defluviitaleaceae bacterium]|nr:pantetheine-phosphate adenylyltransferase [Defluviitaleaceae bacterium]MCL2262343.1 pantetheine-phosphate adenylyltransferase [Defluviitaleaceae bacterium]